MREPDRRAGFVTGQHFWLAQPEKPENLWLMAIAEEEPADNRSPRESGFRPPPGERAGSEPVSLGEWKRLNDREMLVQWTLCDPSWKRVGLVCGAGLGKTTTLEWLAASINRHHKDGNSHLAVVCPLEDFAEDNFDLLKKLAGRLRQFSGADENLNQDALIRIRDQGNLILLLDGLDQAGSDPKGPVVKNLLKLFEHPWNQCRIWISSRPYAFRNIRETLEKASPNIPWTVLRVAQLDEPESKLLLEIATKTDLPHNSYPKPHLFDSLPGAGQRLARIPRYGRLIPHLGEATRKLLTNEASLYHELFHFLGAGDAKETGVLADGLKAAKAARLGWQDLPSWQNPPDNDANRENQVNLAARFLGAISMEMFCQGFAKDRQPRFRILRDLSVFQTQVKKRMISAGAYFLSQGEILESRWFNSDWEAVMAMDSHKLKHFLFSAHATDGCLQWNDITTAAYFAAHWACNWETEDELKRCQAWIVHPRTRHNSAFTEFWTMAVDLPQKAVNQTKRETLLGLLYRDRVRSTEFLYKSWDLMSGTQAQKEFLGERKKLESKFKEIEGDWVTLPEGICPFGADSQRREPGRPTPVASFRLQKFPVTNAQYKLFDTFHSKKSLISNLDNQPVVNVTFYDAWCFALWVGHRLPNEVEWEYACRTGTKTPYFYGETADHKKMNFDRKIGNTTLKGRFDPNDWGLYDMHGNVWEWCDSLFEFGTSIRVVRGGCWFRGGEGCRSAYRDGYDPSAQFECSGFRLAAGPWVGGKSCKE